MIYKEFKTVKEMHNFLTDPKEIKKVKAKYPPPQYSLQVNELDIRLDIVQFDPPRKGHEDE